MKFHWPSGKTRKVIFIFGIVVFLQFALDAPLGSFTNWLVPIYGFILVRKKEFGLVKTLLILQILISLVPLFMWGIFFIRSTSYVPVDSEKSPQEAKSAAGYSVQDIYAPQ